MSKNKTAAERLEDLVGSLRQTYGKVNLATSAKHLMDKVMKDPELRIEIGKFVMQNLGVHKKLDVVDNLSLAQPKAKSAGGNLSGASIGSLPPAPRPLIPEQKRPVVLPTTVRKRLLNHFFLNYRLHDGPLLGSVRPCDLPGLRQRYRRNSVKIAADVMVLDALATVEEFARAADQVMEARQFPVSVLNKLDEAFPVELKPKVAAA